MIIHFYLNNEEETHITSFHDLKNNPFKLRDEIYLKVEELYPITTLSATHESKKQLDYRLKLISDNKKLKESFDLKKIKLLKEGKHIDFNLLKEPTLTIEYHCEIIDD